MSTTPTMDDVWHAADAAAADFYLDTDDAFVRPYVGWLSGEPLVDIGVRDVDGVWHTETCMGDVYDAAWSLIGIVQNVSDDGGSVAKDVEWLVTLFADLLLSYGDFGEDD